jgi:uncharacterized membrane protein affecting hemolysin expression
LFINGHVRTTLDSITHSTIALAFNHVSCSIIIIMMHQAVFVTMQRRASDISSRPGATLAYIKTQKNKSQY